MVPYYEGPRKSHSGAWLTLAALAAVGTLGYVAAPEETKAQLTTFHDECGEWQPFYKPDEAVVISCSSFVDRTNQETVKEVFTYRTVGNGAVKLANGAIGIPTQVEYEPSTPQRLFGEADAGFTLTDLDQVLQTNEDLRANCVADMLKIIDFAKLHAEEVSSTQVSAFEIGSADNAYAVGPAGRGVNNPNTPDIFVIDADSGLPAQSSIVECWTP